MAVYPEMLGSVLDAVTRTTGLDIRKAIAQTEATADAALEGEGGAV